MRNKVFAGLMLVSLLVASGAAAQERPDRKEREPAVRQAWGQILQKAREQGVLKEGVVPEQSVYAALVAELLKTEAAARYLELTERDRKQYLGVDPEHARDIGANLAGDAPALAKSSNAAATNPVRVGLLERSGIIDMLSVALQGSKLVAADDTAVTVNLSAAALLCKACRGTDSAAATRYRAGGWLNRLGGSFTFGAKLPEKDIIGFTGLPDLGHSFDVIVWDAKLRLIGDRDPRSTHWDHFLLGDLGGLDEIRNIADSDVADLRIGNETPEVLQQRSDLVRQSFDPVVDRRTDEVTREIKRSLQVSVAFSGQHLTKQAGMNKYSGVLMADKGFGGFDGTLNVSYSTVQDVKLAKDMPVTLKQWKASAGFVGPIWKGVFVENRSAEWALSGEAFVPVDGPEVPIERKTTYKADLQLKIPISETLELPFSVTYTNDPNELSKKNYVTGRLGISYDFGALKRLALGK